MGSIIEGRAFGFLRLDSRNLSNIYQGAHDLDFGGDRVLLLEALRDTAHRETLHVSSSDCIVNNSFQLF
jgi:hypothetical protein